MGKAICLRPLLALFCLPWLAIGQASVSDAPARLWLESVNGGAAGQAGPVATINGAPVRLIYDTGTSVNVGLLSTCVDRLGIGLEIPIPVGVREAPSRPASGLTMPFKLELFGHVMPDASVPVIRVPSEVAQWSEEVIDGVIGWAGMRNAVWGFFGNEGFGQLDEVPVEAKKWIKLKLSEENGTLSWVAPPNHEGVSRIIIDTGNPDGVLLPPALWQSWQAGNSSAPRTNQIEHIPGQPLRCVTQSWASHFRLGSIVVKDVPVQAAGPAYYREQASRNETVIVFGLTALNRLQVVLDGPSGLSYVQSSDSMPPPYPHNRLGISFLADDTGDLLACVASGSPAEHAGLRSGDVLVAVDGRSVMNWRADREIRRAMSGRVAVGTSKSFTVRRAETEVSIDVSAAEILRPTTRLP